MTKWVLSKIQQKKHAHMLPYVSFQSIVTVQLQRSVLSCRLCSTRQRRKPRRPGDQENTAIRLPQDTHISSVYVTVLNCNYVLVHAVIEQGIGEMGDGR